MTTKTQTLPNLASIVHASEEAAREAAELFAKANAAKAKAADAAAAVDATRTARAAAYADKLTADYPDASAAALEVLASARASLEDAVQTGGNVFGCYMAWVHTSIDVWALDEERSAARDIAGQPTTRTPNPPAFNFAVDVAAIVDGLAMQAQDEAIQQIRERRARFMSGKES